MSILQIGAVAVVSMLLSVLLKQYKREYAVALQIVTGVVIAFLIIAQLAGIINEVMDLTSSIGLNLSYVQLLVKVLGICIVTQFISDLCKDAGESALASQVELAGKVIIVALILPLMRSIISLVIGIIN
ncbi:MAG: stage III sporulation AC/AD family protein [Clostridiales bacterium]|nr:stage III sporulation AC/AD family protein [Clostridiales bacterium]